MSNTRVIYFKNQNIFEGGANACCANSLVAVAALLSVPEDEFFDLFSLENGSNDFYAASLLDAISETGGLINQASVAQRRLKKGADADNDEIFKVKKSNKEILINYLKKQNFYTTQDFYNPLVEKSLNFANYGLNRCISLSVTTQHFLAFVKRTHADGRTSFCVFDSLGELTIYSNESDALKQLGWYIKNFVGVVFTIDNPMGENHQTNYRNWQKEHFLQNNKNYSKTKVVPQATVAPKLSTSTVITDIPSGYSNPEFNNQATEVPAANTYISQNNSDADVQNNQSFHEMHPRLEKLLIATAIIVAGALLTVSIMSIVGALPSLVAFGAMIGGAMTLSHLSGGWALALGLGSLTGASLLGSYGLTEGLFAGLSRLRNKKEPEINQQNSGYDDSSKNIIRTLKDQPSNASATNVITNRTSENFSQQNQSLPLSTVKKFINLMFCCGKKPSQQQAPEQITLSKGY